jgi:hypothetical protein
MAGIYHLTLFLSVFLKNICAMKNKFRISANDFGDSAFPFDGIFAGVYVNFKKKDLCTFEVDDCHYSISDVCVLNQNGDVLQIKSDNGFVFIRDPHYLRDVEEGLDLSGLNNMDVVSSSDLRDEEEIDLHFGRYIITARRDYIKVIGKSTFADIYARWRIAVAGTDFLYISIFENKRENVFMAIKRADELHEANKDAHRMQMQR